MKKITFAILFCMACFIGGDSFGEIREIESMQQILKEVTPQTLVVFDIDNTLIEPIHSLGSDQWYYYIIRKYKEVDHLSDTEAYNKSDQVWNKSQWLVEAKSVEKSTPQLVQRLKKRGIKIVALTARTFDIADITLKQLNSVGIHFEQKPLSDKNLEIKVVDTARYIQGVIYQGEHNDKGKVLVEFLKTLNLKPKKIVFVDDKQKHVNNMEKALQGQPLKYIGFRYGAADQRVKTFNQDLEDIDLFCNGNWTPQAQKKSDERKQSYK